MSERCWIKIWRVLPSQMNASLSKNNCFRSEVIPNYSHSKYHANLLNVASNIFGLAMHQTPRFLSSNMQATRERPVCSTDFACNLEAAGVSCQSRSHSDCCYVCQELKRKQRKTKKSCVFCVKLVADIQHQRQRASLVKISGNCIWNVFVATVVYRWIFLSNKSILSFKNVTLFLCIVYAQ